VTATPKPPRKIDYIKQIYREEGLVILSLTVLRRLYLYIPLIPEFFTWLGQRASFGFGAEKILYLSPVTMNQSNLQRREVMRRIATGSFKNKINMLEVGTWFGTGSTKVWLENIPPGSSVTLLDSWKSYVTKSDSSLGRRGYAAMDLVHHAAIVSSLKNVYRAEADPARDLQVTVIRGKSGNVLAQLRPGSFDLIYIDGSHYYGDVKRDISLAKDLLTPGYSILCGDDFECFPTPELLAHARENVHSDYILSPAGPGYHPGVLLAISEELSAVNMENGFWWVYFRNGKFSLQ
jgi:hypothetical protein